MTRRALVGLVGLVGLVVGCGGRDAFWDAALPGRLQFATGESAVGVLDAPAERVVLLSVRGDLELETAPVRVGKGAVGLDRTPDRRSLLALTRGVTPRRRAADEGPALTAIDAGEARGTATRYELSDPLSGLSVDPESRFAVVYATPADDAFVSNPNELIFVDLSAPPGPTNPTPRTLRSFGGRPLRLDFTEELTLSTGSRRLLVSQSDRDVSLIDLSDLAAPEVTVKLGPMSSKSSPSAIAVSDGDPAVPDDAKLALRLPNDPNVVLIELLPPTAPGQGGFRVAPNVVALGAAPTDLAFVKTDGGERLAAMLPTHKALALVDTATGSATEIALGVPLERISLVTDVVGAGSDGADTALVWSPNRAAIGLVALGKTVGKPYKSVDIIELASPVTAVHAVPGKNSYLKILETASGQGFFVLDLEARTVAPLVASERGIQLTLSPDGERAWIFAGTDELASVGLPDLHPKNLLLRRAVDGVADVARVDGGRALVVLHGPSALGVTLLDARAPSLDDARELSGILLGGAK